jgi:hypothetical protein
LRYRPFSTFARGAKDLIQDLQAVVYPASFYSQGSLVKMPSIFAGFVVAATPNRADQFISNLLNAPDVKEVF